MGNNRPRFIFALFALVVSGRKNWANSNVSYYIFLNTTLSGRFKQFETVFKWRSAKNTNRKNSLYTVYSYMKSQSCYNVRSFFLSFTPCFVDRISQRWLNRFSESIENNYISRHFFIFFFFKIHFRSCFLSRNEKIVTLKSQKRLKIWTSRLW